MTTLDYTDDGLPPPKIRRLLRVAAAMTQTEMGAKLDASASSVSQWEQGGNPRGETRFAYAALLRELRTELDGGHAY